MKRDILFKKIIVGIISFFIFVLYLVVRDAIKGKEFGVSLYIIPFALLLFVIYGGLISLYADKVIERWKRFPCLVSLLLYLLGGAVFPLVLSFIINPSQTIEQPDIGYDTGLLPLGLFSSAIYWVVHVLFSSLSKYK